MNDLRVAIAGTGMIGAVHAHAARAAGAAISYVTASSAASAEPFAQAWGAEAVDPESITDHDFDVLHICTPNVQHAPLALAALEAGKHVICEKPLAVSSGEAADLRDAAKSSGLVDAVPFVYRYHPMARHMAALAQRGDLGKVHSAHGSYLQDWLLSPEDTSWRVDPALGGQSRTFGDIGVHWFDLFEFATGEKVTRLVTRLFRAHDVRAGAPVSTEDGATVLFETLNGIVGVVMLSQISAGRKNRLQISLEGTQHTVDFDQERPETLWFGDVNGNRELSRGAAQEGEQSRRLSFLPAGHPQGYQDAFDGFVADTYAAIAGETPEGLPRFEDGLRAAVLTEAVLRSSDEQRWVDVR